MTARRAFNILISGVGGQGVVLASYVLSQVALAEGYDVKQSEVHGMAQRGGCVTSHLRFGEKVCSSLITPGTVDVLLAFESAEAARYVHWLRPDGLLVYNALRLNSSTISAGLAEYPEDIDARIAAAWTNVCALDANALAAQAGTPQPVEDDFNELIDIFGDRLIVDCNLGIRTKQSPRTCGPWRRRASGTGVVRHRRAARTGESVAPLRLESAAAEPPNAQ